MQQHIEDRRWHVRRQFWFPSGITVDRRAALPRDAARATVDDRRASRERRVAPRRACDQAPRL